MTSKPIILFIAPHADDIELLCGSTCAKAVDLNYEVHECLSNSDEFGTKRREFRGRRIARIRRHEMMNAAKCYGRTENGKAKIILHWMPYIDGFVPFNHESVSRYQQLIETISPHMIFGPDPFFTIDSHPDHLNTGRNYYYALKKITPENRPRYMYFIQSYVNNIAFPSKYRYEVINALYQHRSQFSPAVIEGLKILSYFIKRSPRMGGHFSDRFRKVSFKNEDHQILEEKWCVLNRFRRGFWQYSFKFGQETKNFYDMPNPEEILNDYRNNGWPGEIFGKEI